MNTKQSANQSPAPTNTNVDFDLKREELPLHMRTLHPCELMKLESRGQLHFVQEYLPDAPESEKNE
jgi:hypothetical protein